MEARQKAKKILGKYGSLQVTWARFDCGSDEDGASIYCGECVVCKYLDFIEWAESVGKPPGSVINRNTFVEAYLKIAH